MTPEEELQRGENARRILDDPLFVEAIATIREEINHQWQKSPARDTDGRERLYLSRKMLDKIEGHLQSVMASGRLAQATLAERLRNRANGRTGSGF
jgi:hypothetical protein